MCEDKIGRVSFVSQSARRHETSLAADDFGIEINQPVMYPLVALFGQSVGYDADALPHGRFVYLERQSYALMPPCCQKRRQMFVLAWEILVDKQDFHAGCQWPLLLRYTEGTEFCKNSVLFSVKKTSSPDVGL